MYNILLLKHTSTAQNIDDLFVINSIENNYYKLDT